MNADLLDHGWVFWHLVHQYPGIWMCPVHRNELKVSTVKSTGIERFSWSLPTEAQLVEGKVPVDQNSRASHLRLTDLIVSLTQRSREDGWLNPCAVLSALHSSLKERGWITAGGNIRLSAAAEDYLSHCSTLRGPEELNGLPKSKLESLTQLGRILRPSRSGIHPLRLLLVIDWLYPNAEAFELALESVDGERNTVHAYEETDDWTKVSHHMSREQVIERLKAGDSAASISKQLGIDVATVMAWAAAKGIQVPRRPKVLKPPIRQMVVDSLRRGAEKSEVSKIYGLSVGMITRLLRTEVGLHAAWATARFNHKQSWARMTWTKICTSHVGSGAKLLRSMEPAAYAWLYRNDKSWLMDITRKLVPVRSNERQSSVRWDERDIHLSTQVKQTAAYLAQAAGDKSLKLWEIYQSLPELKPKLSALERLPLTKRALEDALRKRSIGPEDGLF